jgi:hypothetical protein
MQKKMGAVTTLFRASYNDIIHNKEQEIVNWTEMVTQKSHALFPVHAAQGSLGFEV